MWFGNRSGGWVVGVIRRKRSWRSRYDSRGHSEPARAILLLKQEVGRKNCLEWRDQAFWFGQVECWKFKGYPLQCWISHTFEVTKLQSFPWRDDKAVSMMWFLGRKGGYQGLYFPDRARMRGAREGNKQPKRLTASEGEKGKGEGQSRGLPSCQPHFFLEVEGWQRSLCGNLGSLGRVSCGEENLDCRVLMYVSLKKEVCLHTLSYWALYSPVTVYLLVQWVNEMLPFWLNYHLGNATIIF